MLVDGHFVIARRPDQPVPFQHAVGPRGEVTVDERTVDDHESARYEAAMHLGLLNKLCDTVPLEFQLTEPALRPYAADRDHGTPLLMTTQGIRDVDIANAVPVGEHENGLVQIGSDARNTTTCQRFEARFSQCNRPVESGFMTTVPVIVD